MSALRAKRRWLKWRRYQRRCDTVAGGRPAWETGLILAPAMPHKMCEGYSLAARRWAHAGRPAPIGIRDVRP